VSLNYYPFHIGDYTAHTAHLDPMEDIAYRRMLDAYYLSEGPLPLDVERIAKLIRMRDHAATVRDVLNEFFVQTPEGWSHARCDAEIMRKQEKSDKARTSAGKRWHSESDADAMRTHSEGNAPNSQEPKKERESVQKPAPALKGCRLPDNCPDADDLAFCKTSRPDLDSAEVAAKFRDYWLGVPGAKGRKTDWPATWRNFVRSEYQRGANGRHSPLVVAHPAAAKPEESILRRISEQNGGMSVTRLRDGRLQCGIRYYRPNGVEEMSI
jgi:uncharacterized protein YdaU (DUF1376 family)